MGLNLSQRIAIDITVQQLHPADHGNALPKRVFVELVIDDIAFDQTLPVEPDHEARMWKCGNLSLFAYFQ